MPLPSPSILGELCRQLDQARSLVGQLSDSCAQSGVSSLGPAGSKTDPLWRDAEKRANAAEARVAKLLRELEMARQTASSSAKETQRLAYQDPLTGLGNSHLLSQLADKLLSQTKPGREVLVMILDVDRFCAINQMLGHDLADELLVRMGERLLEHFGAGAAVGRLSEDEFVLVVSDLPAREADGRARSLGAAIRQQLARPFVLQGQELVLTVSQGGALGCSETTARVLFQQARTALAYAKSQGRDQIHLYDAELDGHLRRDASLEFQLRYALEAGEMFMEYLPTVWLEKVENGQAHGRVIGVEALLKWRHRTDGILMTADFLQAAEHSGRSVELGHKAVEMVCDDYQRWTKAGLELYATVRLSARQLLSTDLVERALKRTEQVNIPRERITFELDEMSGCLEQPQIDRNLTALQTAGFTLSLGNFGEGASSLRRLRQVSCLKLSPALLQEDTGLCLDALAIATGMKKLAIATGVEDYATARFLFDHGCRVVCGEAFSKPLQAAEVLGLASSTSCWSLGEA